MISESQPQAAPAAAIFSPAGKPERSAGRAMPYGKAPGTAQPPASIRSLESVDRRIKEDEQPGRQSESEDSAAAMSLSDNLKRAFDQDQARAPAAARHPSSGPALQEQEKTSAGKTSISVQDQVRAQVIQWAAIAVHERTSPASAPALFEKALEVTEEAVEKGRLSPKAGRDVARIVLEAAARKAASAAPEEGLPRSAVPGQSLKTVEAWGNVFSPRWAALAGMPASQPLISNWQELSRYIAQARRQEKSDSEEVRAPRPAALHQIMFKAQSRGRVLPLRAILPAHSISFVPPKAIAKMSIARADDSMDLADLRALIEAYRRKPSLGGGFLLVYRDGVNLGRGSGRSLMSAAWAAAQTGAYGLARRLRLSPPRPAMRPGYDLGKIEVPYAQALRLLSMPGPMPMGRARAAASHVQKLARAYEELSGEAWPARTAIVFSRRLADEVSEDVLSRDGAELLRELADLIRDNALALAQGAGVPSSPASASKELSPSDFGSPATDEAAVRGLLGRWAAPRERQKAADKARSLGLGARQDRAPLARFKDGGSWLSVFRSGPWLVVRGPRGIYAFPH